ncbi:hypothetical protein D9611_011261 [Ephemerocybe angulata]|uniref:CCHC-type domain-containing protein n=1 Tax=Ephemerocybe angulata TaxID=980116 RepID=A0A8H5BC53_9AGAR|nr:hypothetical protein D9611_011261 [Tulosesus angulatus]
MTQARVAPMFSFSVKGVLRVLTLTLLLAPSGVLSSSASPVLAGPIGKNCTSGSIHNGTATGRNITIAGVTFQSIFVMPRTPAGGGGGGEDDAGGNGGGGSKGKGRGKRGTTEEEEEEGEIGQGSGMEKMLVMLLQQMRKDKEEERKDREADRAEREEYRTHLAELMTRFTSTTPNQDSNLASPTAPVFNVSCESRTPPWAFDLKQFSGNAEDVQSHLAVCELAFDADLPRVLTNRQKILLSLKYCSEGAAKPWYDSCIASLSSGAWATRTWDEYKAQFTITFGDQFLTEEARRQLETTVKEPNESAGSFFLRYDNLRVKAGIASPIYDISCIQAVRLRLPYKLHKKIPNDVTSYDLFRQRVINEDNERREGDKADAHYTARTIALVRDPPPHVSKGSWRSTNPPAIRTPTLPTSTATIAPKTKGLSEWKFWTRGRNSQFGPRVRDFYSDSPLPKTTPLALPAPPTTTPSVTSTTEFNGICYKCGQHGHRRPECPNPAKTGKIAVMLETVAEALEEGGKPEYAEELIRMLEEVNEKDFGNGEL